MSRVTGVLNYPAYQQVVKAVFLPPIFVFTSSAIVGSCLFALPVLRNAVHTYHRLVNSRLYSLRYRRYYKLSVRHFRGYPEMS